ncbi:3-oxoacyl-[acyl-carrier-protein] synthase-3 [Nocardia tenerifensis]|uniref:3-oxoacyl-[acyl-carrier-protein] synthase-3 n=1 Tax=Nocardia tenerifensis TaxID=228006 RepID=A0A318JSJ7_9NOCA|nr:3-oxoacyl-[acyl-carrier-protein] synthase III C-terminal domain-containing protein [Nocardia tenerifensis]PXX55545.1 3-oxoacyl-[acyl-carrier-protein] synthase-3 [Nocardia tenerifensis]
MTAVTIASTGAYLPGAPLTNADLENLCGTLPSEVLAGLQVQRRHWAIDPKTGRHLVSNADMAEAAARQALDRAGLEPGEVELLVMSTSSPEYHLPAEVTFVQARLGLARCAVIEVRSGCAGAVQALDIAWRMVAAGRYANAVVLGSEVISPLLYPYFDHADPQSVRLRDRIAIYNFGDGAGALVLTAAEGPDRWHGGVNACMGGDRRPGMHIVGGGTHAPIADQLAAKRLVQLHLDVVESERFGPRVFAEAIDRLLDESGLTIADVAACVLPEGNAPYFTAELEASGMSAETWKTLQAKIVENLTDVGATGSAAVPLALDDAWQRGRIGPGDRILLLAIETSRWIYAGAALTWTARKVAR